MTALKLDENLSDELLRVAREHGFDAESVRSQGMAGASDASLHALCRSEDRVLVTLDLDFSDPVRFPPAHTAGTVVLRPARPAMNLIATLFEAALRRLATDSPRHAIWIVEPGRVRIHRSWDTDA